MDLKHLRYLVSVAELGSFTKAAAVHGLAQSAVSRHVQALEADLGAKILHRTGRGAVPTDLGRAVLPRIKALVEEADRLARDLRATQAQPSGLVRLGVLTSLGQVLLTPLLSSLHERSPGIRVRVIEGLTDHLDELIATGRVDIAVLYDNRQTANAADEPLFQADLFLIGGPAAPLGGTVRLAELARFPLVVPAMPNRLRVLVERVCAAHGVRLNVAFEIDAIGTMRDLAADGAFCTLLPRHAILGDLAAGRVRAARIVEPTITRKVLLTATGQQPLDRAGLEVARTVKQISANLVRAGRLQGL